VSSPCRQLDFEVELALVVGQGSEMGSSIDVNEAEDHIFGVVLMNDWSARDIQLWESTLIGPFNGKNFCTTISPWIVPLEALEPFRTPPRMPVSHRRLQVEKTVADISEPGIASVSDTEESRLGV
jgi:fumarylacetoacetase